MEGALPQTPSSWAIQTLLAFYKPSWLGAGLALPGELAMASCSLLCTEVTGQAIPPGAKGSQAATTAKGCCHTHIF